jgi:rod shape-determining protein MreC
VVVTFFQLSNPHKRLFAKGKYRSNRFVFACALSFIIMAADYHYHALGQARSVFTLVVSPLQYLVDYPVRMVGWVHSLVSSKKSLIDENIQLRYQQTLLEAKLQKLLVIRNENSQLKELLSASSAVSDRAMAAEILAVDTTASRQLLILNKGKQDQVYIGQPVLDAKGVTGQVIDVGMKTSTVLLISDSKSAVPVRNNRTGERAILIGTNNMSKLFLINLPKSSSITKGDLLVTSGLGRRYPEGYPVGQVEAIQTLPGDDFIKVTVSPVAQLNRSRLVLLIWPDKEETELTKQIDERIKVVEENEANA